MTWELNWHTNNRLEWILDFRYLASVKVFWLLWNRIWNGSRMEQAELGSYLKKVLWKHARFKRPRILQSNNIQVNSGYLESGLILMFSGTFTLPIWPSVERPLISEGDQTRSSSSDLCKWKINCHAFWKWGWKKIPKHQLSVFHVLKCFYVSTVRKKIKSKETEMGKFLTKQNNIHCCRQWFCWHINLFYY